MKYSSYVAIIAALFVSKAAASGFEWCGSNSDDFDFQSIIFSPSQLSRDQPVNLDLMGELREPITQDAKITFDMRGEGIHEVWQTDFYSAIYNDDIKALPFSENPKHIRPYTYFPPAFGTIKKDAEVNIRIVARQGSDDSSKRIFCVQGKVYLS
ncbi:hypothetical protein BGW41_002192 [Actinomortierella wolfii]|nr:hypothetical protein BGW41_002192 [Actinomortierella wolfii]